jgi:hypothetical protein
MISFSDHSSSLMSTRALKATVAQCRGIVRGTSFAGALPVRLAHSKSESAGSTSADPASTPPPKISVVTKPHDIVVGQASVPVPASKRYAAGGMCIFRVCDPHVRCRSSWFCVAAAARNMLDALVRLPDVTFKTGDEFLKPVRLATPVLVPYLDTKTVYATRKPLIRLYLQRVYDRWAEKYIYNIWVRVTVVMICRLMA